MDSRFNSATANVPKLCRLTAMPGLPKYVRHPAGRDQNSQQAGVLCDVFAPKPTIKLGALLLIDRLPPLGLPPSQSGAAVREPFGRLINLFNRLAAACLNAGAERAKPLIPARTAFPKGRVAMSNSHAPRLPQKRGHSK